MSWRFSSSYIASSTFFSFQKIAWQFELEPRGWREFGARDGDYATLDTQYTNSMSRGVAVHASQAVGIFEWLQANGTGNAQRAVGLNGDVKMTCPSTSVTCQPLSESQDSQTSSPSNSSVSVVVPADADATTFFIHVMPQSTDDNFSGATCEVHYQQVLFPANVWWTAGTDAASASVNLYDKKFDIEPEGQPFAPIDAFIAKAMAVQVQANVQRLEHVVHDMTCASWLMEIAREVHFRRPEYKSNIEALSPVVALLTNHLLAAALWNVTYPEDQQVESTNIRWQLYGSGPRFPWAWSSAIILGVLTIAISASAILSFWHMIVPGEWLKAAGMLVAANSSPPVLKLREALPKQRHELEAIQVGIRLGCRPGTVEVVNAEGRTDVVALDESYGWTA